MANPIALAAALAGARKLTCPHCGRVKLVAGARKAYRVCPRCHKRFVEPKRR